MNFDAVFNSLLKRGGTGAGPEGFRALLARLGNPQEKYRILHVAGTNGKGTVCTLLARTASAAGDKTGLFVSPHLVSPTERIEIDGKLISKQAFCRTVSAVLEAEEEPLNFFEILTAAAFLYFARQGVQTAVLETGLGGRKDPTNVCRPVLTLITSIGLDHTQYLGNTLAQIAHEKAGILKPGISVLCGALAQEAKQVITQAAQDLRAPLRFVQEGEPFREYAYDFVNGQTVLRTQQGGEWLLHALGGRQTQNACLVYQAARQLHWPETAVKKAFEQVTLPGRFELCHVGKTPFILDGAHNPQAIETLLAFWQKTPYPQDTALLCGFMRDKDYKKMLALLCAHFKTIILTVPPSPRGAGAEALLAALPKGARVTVEPDWARALALAEKFPRVLCTGSFYLVGAVRAKAR